MIGFPNRINEAALSGGAWLAALPLANVQNETLGKVARSVDLLPASTLMNLDLGESKNIRALDLRKHNLSLDAKFRVRATDEQPATNEIRNNSALGGSLPLYWASGSGAITGITVASAGAGVSDGVDYLDLRYSGVPSMTGWITLMFEVTSIVPASVGQRWVTSAYLGIAAGNLSGVGEVRLSVPEYNGAAWLADNMGADIDSELGPDLKRFSHVQDLANPATTFVRSGMFVRVTAGAAIDVTFRIGLAQLERDQMTSAIKTAGAAATRPLGFMDEWQSYGFDSGWLDVWPSVFSPDALEWEDNNWWTGKYTDEQRAGYTPGRTLVLPDSVLARFWRIELLDPTNPAGFVELGRVFIGPAWQPSANMSRGASLAWETRTSVQETDGGAEFFNVKTPVRVARFSLDWMTESEGMGRAFDLLRSAGINREVLWIHDPTDTEHALRRQFLGRFRQLNPIEFPYATVNRSAFEIKEKI